MRNGNFKYFKILFFAIILHTNCIAQKSSFLTKANSDVFYSANNNGWVKFNPSCQYNETTIFTAGKSNFNLTNGYEMKLIKTSKDESGAGHYKFQQLFNGIDILGGQYIIHTKEGKLQSGNGERLSAVSCGRLFCNLQFVQRRSQTRSFVHRTIGRESIRRNSRPWGLSFSNRDG